VVAGKEGDARRELFFIRELVEKIKLGQKWKSILIEPNTPRDDDDCASLEGNGKRL